MMFLLMNPVSLVAAEAEVEVEAAVEPDVFCVNVIVDVPMITDAVTISRGK